MKRIAIILSFLCLAFVGNAQTDAQSVVVTQDSNCRHVEINLDLGLSAGASLLSANIGSPYYSKYGFTLQIPLMMHWQFAPHWKLSTGLRYDFSWYPLYYNVEINADRTGICFPTEPTTATRRGYAYGSYVGVPVELKWYPRANSRGSLGVALDVFTGYAVSSNITINERQVERLDNIAVGLMNIVGNQNRIVSALQPWKVEIGLSFTTDKLGLLHGIRLFANCLPTFVDPATGDQVYTSGITMFL